jgi:hypothetical protein
MWLAACFWLAGWTMLAAGCLACFCRVASFLMLAGWVAWLGCWWLPAYCSLLAGWHRWRPNLLF